MSSSTTVLPDSARMVINGVTVLRLLRFTPTAASGENTWADSGSGGHNNRTPGNSDLTASVEVKVDTGQYIWDTIKRGVYLTNVVLWINTTKYYYMARALVTNGPNPTVDLTSRETVSVTFDIGSDGISYVPGEAGAPAAVHPG